MKFAALAVHDSQYLKALKELYRSLFISFVVIFYAASSLIALTDLGLNATDHLIPHLPGAMKFQVQALEGIDGRSHVSYIIAIPIIAVLGLIYSRRQYLLTLGLKRRNLAESRTVTASGYEATALAVLLAIVLTVIFFSGTISTGQPGSKSGGWLLWPVSGLFYFGGTLLLVVTINSFMNIRIFGRSGKKEN